MQPKRTSFDVKLYMQLHRKVLRKAIIEKKFEQSLYQFSNHIDYGRKGFKGSVKPETFLQRSNSYREKKIYTEPAPPKNSQNTIYSATHSNLTREGEEGRRMTAAAQTSHSKPNMMYNLSLYRKSYKRQDLKNDKICINVIQDLKKTREAASRTSSIHRSKKMLTVT